MRQYLPLKHKSFQLGDEYYRCVGEKLRLQKTGSIEECLKLGREYRQALEQQLEDLERFSDPNFIERERQLVAEYINLIEHDLNHLSKGEIDRLLKNRRPSLEL